MNNNDVTDDGDNVGRGTQAFGHHSIIRVSTHLTHLVWQRCVQGVISAITGCSQSLSQSKSSSDTNGDA